MEKSELNLVSEWLKSSDQMVLQSLNYDDQMTTKTSRNKSSADGNNSGSGHPFTSDRITSAYFRRNASGNGSSRSKSQVTFGSNRKRDWEKGATESGEKEKPFLSDHRRENPDHLGSFLPSRSDKGFRRSQSMVTEKQSETLPKNMLSYSSNAKTSGLQAGVSIVGNVHKPSFEKDFPSLRDDERQASEIRRVSSPGLGASALTSGETWTSALAKLPVESGIHEFSSVRKVITPSTVLLASGTPTGLNMAETVAQGSSRAQTPPQVSCGTQRLEELAIKQSKQLIPVTPSMPKALVLNSSEKPKAKHGIQQFSSPHAASRSPRSVPATPDLLKIPGVGKLQILKPSRERNGTLASLKDSSSQTSVSRILPNTPHSVGSAVSKNLLEKKLTPQAKSRNDFFNLMRKKSVSSPCCTSTGPGVVSCNSAESEISNAPLTSQDGDLAVLKSSFVVESYKKGDDKRNGNSSERPLESLCDKVSGPFLIGNDLSSSKAILSSEEEEAAFLRSLGWEEDDQEDEGLTEEEISSFLNEYIKKGPSTKISQAMQPKFLELLNLSHGSVGGVASSGLSSSSSKLKS